MPRSCDESGGMSGSRAAALVAEVADLATTIQLLKADLRLGEGLPGHLPDHAQVVARVKARITDAESRLETAKAELAKTFDGLAG